MKQPINRGYFGQIVNTITDGYNCPVFAYGSKAISLAVAQGMLKGEYCSVDRKHRGDALNYDIYDVDIKKRLVLVQRRHTVCTKYGNSPTKDYFLIKLTRNKVEVQDFNSFKPVIVKLSRVCNFAGELLKTLLAKLAA